MRQGEREHCISCFNSQMQMKAGPKLMPGAGTRSMGPVGVTGNLPEPSLLPLGFCVSRHLELGAGLVPNQSIPR